MNTATFYKYRKTDGAFIAPFLLKMSIESFE